MTATETTTFVYGNGDLLEERNSSGVLTTSYIYAGKQLLATETATDTNYTATDNLGSPRVITNSTGSVVARRDFLPFGEELFADGTYRKTSDGYTTSGSDAVRQRFTGYQRDLETGLDFAEARYYDISHGRFTAVDPLLASGKSANPQTFNRYVYVGNNPLVLRDPNGLQAGTKDEQKEIRINTEINKSAPKILDTKVTYLDKDQYGTAVPVGGRFMVTYKYLINKPDEGSKPGDYGKIEATVKDKTTIREGKVVKKDSEKSPNATFTTAESVESIGGSVSVTTGKKK